MTATVAPAAIGMDAAALRADFPILQRLVHGRPLVYLDSAATSQKPESVLRALDAFYRHGNANVHRGVYLLSGEATQRYEAARAAVGRFIGAKDAREIVFTRGATEAINLVAHSWGTANVGRGDVIVATELEHHSNLVPWQLLAERVGAELRYLRLTDEGTLDLSGLPAVLDGNVKLLAFGHVSNALGTINPVPELVAAAHAAGALALLDAAQSVPHMPVDVERLGVDFLAFSGHKMCGPTGIGGLWARKGLLDAMPPYQSGGEMILTVSLEGSTWAEAPAKFEAGTPAIAQAIGLAEAVSYLESVGMEAIHAHEQDLVHYGMDLLAEVPGLRIHGPRSQRSGSITFTLDGVHPHDLASILDHRGIAIRAGHHCTMPVHARLGIPASARASFYLYTVRDDLDRLVDGLHAARSLFGLP